MFARAQHGGLAMCLCVLGCVGPQDGTGGADKSAGEAKSSARVEHEYFQVEVPAWSDQVNEGGPNSGFVRRRRSQPDERVQVAWEFGSVASEAEVELGLRNVLSDIGCDVVEFDRTRSDAGYRQHALCRMAVNKTVYMAASVVYCARNQHIVTLWGASFNRKRAKALRQAMLDSFRCRGSKSSAAPQRMVSSTLGAEWGYSRASNVDMLAHADGRSILVTAEVGGFGQKIDAHPQFFVDVMSRRTGYALRALGTPFQLKSVDGTISVLHARTGASPIALGWFYCEATAMTYTLFAMRVSGEPESLSTPLAEFGCPGSGPPASKRSNNCDLPGHEDACIR